MHYYTVALKVSEHLSQMKVVVLDNQTSVKSAIRLFILKRQNKYLKNRPINNKLFHNNKCANFGYSARILVRIWEDLITNNLSHVHWNDFGRVKLEELSYYNFEKIWYFI